MNRPGRLLELACLLILTLAGFVLRSVEIDTFGLSPDDGNYLQSAGVLRMPRQAERNWFDQDRDWYERPKTYPHSYIHQYAIRWLKRAGADNVAAVRLGSAVLGALTPWVLFLLIAGRKRERWREGMLAAAMLAGYIMHCWYSRTGWGQPGCTFFYMVYLLFADRLFHEAEGRSRGRTAWQGFGMMLAALAAYGYHEMIVVHVAGMGLYSLLFLKWNRGLPGGKDRIAAVIAFGIACVPVTAWASTLLGDSFATQHWSGVVKENQGNYFEYRWSVIRLMYRNYGLHEQIGWVVLALSIPGMAFMWKRDRKTFRFLFTMFLVSWAAFFFGFRDPYLVRVYLPTFILLVAFSAEGALGIASRLGESRRVLARVVIAGLVLLLWAQSVATIFVERDTPITVASFYTPRKVAHRRSLQPIADHLHEHRKSGQILGISDDRAPLFWLQDEGISSRPHNGRRWNLPQKDQPMWIVRPKKLMESAGKTLETGGPYELIVTDTAGRLGLYRVKRP